jgi:hypothetical protein
VITSSVHYSLTIVGWLALGLGALGWSIGEAIKAWTLEKTETQFSPWPTTAGRARAGRRRYPTGCRSPPWCARAPVWRARPPARAAVAPLTGGGREVVPDFVELEVAVPA